MSIDLIFSVTYCPGLNPIEFMLAKAKFNFKKMKLEENIMGLKHNPQDHLRNSFSLITTDDCRKFIRGSWPTVAI